MAALAIGSAFGWLSRDTLLAIVFFTGAARAFEQTALATLLPGIVPVSLLSRATAASASAFQIAVIGGPAVGGLLTAISPVLVFALCCLLYIISSTVISMVTVERNASLRKPVSFAVLFAGSRYIWHNGLYSFSALSRLICLLWWLAASMRCYPFLRATYSMLNYRALEFFAHRPASERLSLRSCSHIDRRNNTLAG